MRASGTEVYKYMVGVYYCVVGLVYCCILYACINYNLLALHYLLIFNMLNNPLYHCLASPSDCPPDWLALDGHCYHHPQKTVTWNEADVWCNSYGARILVLETEEERVAVRSIIDLSNMWLGCNDKDIESNWICYNDILAEFWCKCVEKQNTGKICGSADQSISR